MLSTGRRRCPTARGFLKPHSSSGLVLRNSKFGLLPSPELKDSISLFIDPKANYGKMARERLLKMLTIPGLDVKDPFLIRR